MIEHSVFLKEAAPVPLSLGDRRVVLSFAGTRYGFSGLTKSQHLTVADRFGPLVVESTGNADLEVQVSQAAISAFQPRPAPPWDYELAISYSPAEVDVSGLNFAATMSRAPLGGTLITPLEGDHFQGPFENFFRVLVAYRFLSQDALVLHSAAITDEEHGFLLFGRSGAGKTTICQLASELGLRVLSDELNALWPTDAGFQLRSMPFAGDFGQTQISSEPSPLTGLYGVEKGSSASTRPCSAAEATSRIIAASPYANADPYIGDTLLDRITEIVDRHPLRILTFAKDASFWGTLNDDHKL